MQDKKLTFSVCMSVYHKDHADDLITAVRSVYNQTAVPSEIILVVDGPVGKALQDAVIELQQEIPLLRVIVLAENMGHAKARQTGLDAANTELVAVMDADDISLPQRFEWQLKVFAAHPEVSVVGGLIQEFVGEPAHIVGTRMVPEQDADIKRYLRSRSPMNLVTVMLRKTDIMTVGGYLDWFCEEDYYLWIRLSRAGYRFYNIQKNLVNVRVGEEMYQRRGGLKYFRSEASIQWLMLRSDIIALPRFVYNVGVRFVVQVLLPNKVRSWFFQHFARQ